MAFYLYDIEDGKGLRRYSRNTKLEPFAGRGGPLTQLIRKGISASTPYHWHFSAAEIMEQMHADPNSHEIILDLKPKVKANVSLFLLKDIWGCSWWEWTPAATLLESLLVDFTVEDPELLKNEFDDREAQRRNVGQFLYLRGGTRGGDWDWGVDEAENGVLLWSESYQYLAGELSKYLSA